VGWLSGFALTVLGVAFAFQVGQVLDAFMFNETIPAFLGIAVMGGILWKGANRYGALAAVGISLAAYYALNYLLTCPWQGRPPAGMTEAFGFFLDAWQQGELGEFLRGGSLKLVYTWAAAPYAWATLVGVVALVAVSALTRPEEKERIERFFDNMRRSTDREGLAEGQLKPPAAEVGQDLILLDLPGWLSAARWRGFFRRYREDVVGFILAWGAVGLLILAAWGLMQIGA
jgi:Na+/proline symporter